MMEVKSTVIDWIDETMTITDRAGKKHTIGLDQTITVTMVGYSAREMQTMKARELDPYMMAGYRIEQIEVKI